MWLKHEMQNIQTQKSKEWNNSILTKKNEWVPVMAEFGELRSKLFPQLDYQDKLSQDRPL